MNDEADTQEDDGPLDPGHPAMWAITYDQFVELDSKAQSVLGRQYEKATMRTVVSDIIEPVCRLKETSYALHINPHGLMIQAFVTHAWDENFSAFVESIRQVFQTTLRKPNLWICACALVQGNAELIKQQIRASDVNNDARVPTLNNSPFVQALKKASAYVVVRNTTTDLFSRIWCVCELLYARKYQLVPTKTSVAGPDSFSHLTTSCKDAKATSAADLKLILRVLRTEHDSKEVDAIVTEFRRFGWQGRSRSQPNQPNNQAWYLNRRKWIIAAVLLLLLLSVILALVLTVGFDMGGNQLSAQTPAINPTPPTATIPPDTPPTAPATTTMPTTAPSTITLPTTLPPTRIVTEVTILRVSFPISSTTRIVIQNQERTGTLPTELGLLTALTELAINGNLLDKTIPTEIGLLTTLSQFVIASNKLEGTIPTELALMTSMFNLNLGNNFLRGLIPTELGLMTGLQRLVLSRNQLTGSIPTELGLLTSLRELWLDANDIVGPIPSELGLISVLNDLLIYETKVDGTIPVELGFLKDIQRVEFQDTNLVGSVPSQMCDVEGIVIKITCGREIACPLTCCTESCPAA